MICNGKLTGVLSFGEIEYSNIPSIYTNIYSYIDWIESNIEPKNNVKCQDHLPYQISWCFDDSIYCFNFCKGFIFSQITIITAAHCCNAIGSPQFTNQDGEILNLSDTKIAAGERRSCTSISHLPSLHGSVQVKKIKSLVMHPQYDSISGTNDICLLTLESPLEFKSYINQINGTSSLLSKPSVDTSCQVSRWSNRMVGINILISSILSELYFLDTIRNMPKTIPTMSILMVLF